MAQLESRERKELLQAALDRLFALDLPSGDWSEIERELETMWAQHS